MSARDTDALRAELEELDGHLLAAAVRPPAAPAVDEAGALVGLRVLVVDDDPDSCELMRVALELCGAHVSTAASAEDGLTRLQTTPPDVLVSDISMPGHDGYWLVREARAGRQGVDTRLPALAVTAFAARHDRTLALASGFDDHLPKPFDPQELCRRVATLATAA